MVPEMPVDNSDNPSDLQEVEYSTTQGTPLADQSKATQEALPADAETGSETMAAESQAPATAMSQIPLDEYDYSRPQRGEVRQGVVLSIHPTEMIIDIGAKRECVVPASDYQKLGNDFVSGIKEGSEVSVYIVKPEDREGHLVGSLHLAELEQDWTRAEEAERDGTVFEAQVIGQNRGGLLVPFGRLRGFVPTSHLIGVTSEAEGRPAALGPWIGKTLPFKVIEVNRRRNRLILSYRAARRQWRNQQKRNLLEGLHDGDIRKGIISSLASFGAFVDLGGADGLIHVSEMAWYRVEHPSEILSVGQEVEVYVLRVDGDRGRIGLSLKRLQPDPWTLVADKYLPGQTVEVTITKLVDFGAFAEVEKGVEGLIHLSELAEPTPARAEEVVAPGQVRLARVLRVDPANRRIGLSLKAVGAMEVEAWEEQRAAKEQGHPPATAEDEPSDAAPDQPQS